MRVFENKTFRKDTMKNHWPSIILLGDVVLVWFLHPPTHHSPPPTVWISRNPKLYINHFWQTSFFLWRSSERSRCLTLGRRQDKWRVPNYIIRQLVQGKRSGRCTVLLYFISLFWIWYTLVYGLQWLNSERKRFETEYHLSDSPLLW